VSSSAQLTRSIPLKTAENQNNETFALANRLYRELLANQFVSKETIPLVYDLFVNSEQTALIREAKLNTVPWVVRLPQNYQLDSGAWIENLIGENGPPDPRLKPWLFERVLADANPYQVEDWGRYLKTYGDIERALPAATSILESGQTDKQESLAARLARRNPGVESEFEPRFFQRYGMQDLSGPPGFDLLETLVRPLPSGLRNELLDNLIAAVRNMDRSIESGDRALNRLFLLKQGLAEEKPDIMLSR